MTGTMKSPPARPWTFAEQELDWGRGEPTNIAWYCTDRICRMGRGDAPALIWEDFQGASRTFTFDDLKRRSDGIAQYLRNLGLGPGERVCLFMDRVPELYIGFLGILKLGAVVQPLFSAFGEESLEVRLKDSGASAIITQRKHLPKVRRILERLPAMQHIIVVDAPQAALGGREVAMSLDALPDVPGFEIAHTMPGSPALLHYTSGTTGQPKGAVHVHAALLAQYWTTRQVLDVRKDDMYWCTADPGWVTGTAYGIVGPWSNGITQVVLDSGFNADRWYRLIEHHRVTVWYTAPTAIRLLMREGTALARRYDLNSLRHLCSVGEPLNAEAVIWSEATFGRPFHDTFWQTETGCIVITNMPGMPVKPGSMGKAFPGISAAVIEPTSSREITEPGRVGLIALKPDFPSLMRAYWQNKSAYDGKFRGPWYVCGDRASVDPDGYFWFVGRDDDVINTAGHLVGPFEVESALLEHPAVAESAAVAKPDPINLEVVKAFVCLKPGFTPGPDLELEIMNVIRKRLSPLAMPQEIAFVDSLPKTRSGKILRRVLRAKEWGQPVGDISTLMEE